MGECGHEDVSTRIFHSTSSARTLVIIIIIHDSCSKFNSITTAVCCCFEASVTEGEVDVVVYLCTRIILCEN